MFFFFIQVDSAREEETSSPRPESAEEPMEASQPEPADLQEPVKDVEDDVTGPEAGSDSEDVEWTHRLKINQHFSPRENIL